jgi:hypothetical protein
MTDIAWPDPNYLEFGPCLASVASDLAAARICGRRSKAVADPSLAEIYCSEAVVWLCSEHGGETAEDRDERAAS